MKRRWYVLIVAVLMAWVAVASYRAGRGSAYEETQTQFVAWRDVQAFINAQSDSIYQLEQSLETVRCASIP